ncbi:MAG: bifunctional D-glycero-beta-D-manno-heptose-7-phosphate kinase/D-glycero-beta-D-manno-heptose 1-phosphate adenylyltransferase HldE [Hyphomicrobiales bacterium]|nr:bifunctional D-glycero-beta-D-manno-heptose-7-phosphate kinase/D-glycero-beta-D-manno-heptose 1-phosphate adenylyltransferase HldE [Hyphomicrobiales bacterium]
MHLVLRNIAEKRVLLVGDAMLDRYMEGPVGRISPEAPVPIVRVGDVFERPGGAANVALNLASLGVAVTFLAYVGDDPDAEALARRLREAGVETRFVTAKAARTIVKLRVLSQRHQLLRLDFEDGFGDQDHARLLADFRAALAGHDLVVLSDYGKGTLAAVAEMIAAARVAGRPVVVDPKGTDFARYAGATAITPNASEFTAVAGRAADEDDFATRGFRLRETLDLEHLLVTRGERGMSLFGPESFRLDIPTQAREVYDVTGAGDTVIATLAAALAAGADFADATRLANLAAGIVVGRMGTATVTLDELSAVAAPLGAPDETETTLRRIAEAKARGERVVMTNGCFDILHAGHVDYLTRAKAFGHRLVVAVNSDASVARLKGSSRPINPLADRMRLLAALKAVDWVVAFDGSIDAEGRHSDTPLDLIRAVAPDVLVKGGDYTIDTIVGASDVVAAGGEVRVLPFVEGRSTSAVIARIAEDAVAVKG